MKKTFRILSLLVLLVVAFSCDRDETLIAKKGYVSFKITQSQEPGGRVSGVNVPTSVLLTIIDAKGATVYESKKVPLVNFGPGYVTENFELAAANYRLTKFLVLNANDQVLYATPLEGSDKASLVSDPLPINFTVNDRTTSEVVPQVLAVMENDTPESFGYISFGFQVVDRPELFKVGVKVQFMVGDILYQDVNTKIKVTGYDAGNTARWYEVFDYTGPNTNEITIRGNYNSYAFEVQHFGKQDRQVFTRSHLWHARVGGLAPVTFVFGGAAAAKKVSHYINYFEKYDTVTGILYMEPQYKIAHEYNADGKLQKINHYQYNAKTMQYTLEKYAVLNYGASKVNAISHYFAHNNELFIEHTYQYDPNGNVSKIEERNIAAGVNSQVNFGYDFSTQMITASYTYSNGGAFIYQFTYNGKNIVSEKTSRFGILCSQGTHTYDKNINPLKHLGYVDYSLRNYSINNRLTENIQYTSCAFPTLVPKSYTYELDADGYPKVATTLYQSGERQIRGQTRYFYQ